MGINLPNSLGQRPRPNLLRFVSWMISPRLMGRYYRSAAKLVSWTKVEVDAEKSVSRRSGITAR